MSQLFLQVGTWLAERVFVATKGKGEGRRGCEKGVAGKGRGCLLFI